MSLLSKLKQLNAKDALEIAGTALGLIGSLTRSGRVEKAANTLIAVNHVYRIAENASDGTVTPQQAMRALQELEEELEKNDQAADAAIDEKFGDDS